MITPTLQYNPRGYEAFYRPAEHDCAVTVRGYMDSTGKIAERGGPTNPNDKPIAQFTISEWDKMPVPLLPCCDPVRDTFIDVLTNRRDLIGNYDFRNKPANDTERRLFASAFDAAQKIRTKKTILNVDKLVFCLNPELFTVVDCFAKDSNGNFWLLVCDQEDKPLKTMPLILAAYVFEHGGYLPEGMPVRIGVWRLTATGAKFVEVANDRTLARDAVINKILELPF